MSYAPVAQWIEHEPSKFVAVGSNPAGRVTVHSLSPNGRSSPGYSLLEPSADSPE